MKVICDVMLGKLSRYLRMLGLDAIYVSDAARPGKWAGEDEPVLFLTRRQKRSCPERCVIIASERVEGQLKEIGPIIRPFLSRDRIMSRCIRCNVELAVAEKADVEQYVPEFVFHQYNEFKRCPCCNRVYWKGSHVRHMLGWIRDILGAEVETLSKPSELNPAS